MSPAAWRKWETALSQGQLCPFSRAPEAAGRDGVLCRAHSYLCQNLGQDRMKQSPAFFHLLLARGFGLKSVCAEG